MKCTQCGKSTTSVSGSFCTYCGAHISSEITVEKPSENRESGIPWESDLRINFPLLALYRTFCKVLFHPDLFYRQATEKNNVSIKPSLSYGLIAGTIGILSSWFWYHTYTELNRPLINYATLFGNSFISPSMLIATPFFIIMQFMVISLYTSIMMRLGRCGKVSVRNITRILCYAESTAVLQIIPVIGSFASMVIHLYSLLTGFHHLFNVSKIRVVFTLILPLVALSFLAAVIVIAGLIGGLIGGTGLFRQWESIF